MLIALAERTAADRMRASDLSEWIRENGIPSGAELSGWVASPPDVDGDTVRFKLKADQFIAGDANPEKAVHFIRETVIVRIKLKEEHEQATAKSWRSGDRLSIEGTPEQPSDAGNFGAFDYRKYLEKQGIHWLWTAEGTSGVRVEEAAVPWHMVPMRLADELRLRISGLMDQLYPGGDAGYMKGLTAGITEEIDPELYDAYSRLGLTHILAISGLHVAVVVFVLLRLGALCRLTRERSIDIAIAVLPFYMLATGASPSVVRACIMGMIALALARQNLLKDGLYLLAAAAMAMTAWDPAIVENISFQLSFAVTTGLLLFTSIMGDALYFVRPKALRDAIAVGLTAQLVSLPLTAYYFHGFHLLSLPANLVLVPVVSFAVLPLGMASAVLGAIWLPLGQLPAAAATYINHLTEALTFWMNRNQSLALIWPQTGKLWVMAAYLLTGITMAALKRRNERRRADLTVPGSVYDETVPLERAISLSERLPVSRYAGAALLVLLWAGWWIWGYKPAFLDRHAYVQFLDVGQGDAVLIRTGSGKHVLVDAGGTVRFRKPGDEWKERRDPYEVGRKLLAPLLKQRGVRALDALVLTHLDMDHIGGAEAVVRSVPVRAIIWNGTWKKDTEAVTGLFREAERRNIPVYAASAGMAWDIDAFSELRILYPQEPTGSEQDADLKAIGLPYEGKQNDSSIVLLLTLHGRSFLLTGDVETRGETEILASLSASGLPSDSSAIPPVDVMKAAHHGSKTSTSPLWLTWWRPAETVISAGRNNPYGHPHPSVVERLESFGTRLLRTDRDGEVRYKVTPDGELLRQVKRHADDLSRVYQ
jgi:competence protein ComEC